MFYVATISYRNGPRDFRVGYVVRERLPTVGSINTPGPRTPFELTFRTKEAATAWAEEANLLLVNPLRNIFEK